MKQWFCKEINYLIIFKKESDDMFVRKKDNIVTQQSSDIQYEKYLISNGKTWTRRFTTSFFGDGFKFIEKERADNMNFFIDAEGIKFGDANLNRMILPKDVLIEAVNKFCICETD